MRPCSAGENSRHDLERHGSFEHQPAEFSAIQNVGRGKVGIGLIHPFRFREQILRDEEAEAELRALNTHVGGRSDDFAGRGIEARRDVHAILREEAVDEIAGELAPCTVRCFRGCGTGGGLDVAEESRW